MRRRRFYLLALICISFFSTAFFSAIAHYQETAQTSSRSVLFFDILDLPARIDEPTLIKKANKYSLTFALANRSGEQLAGLRLTLMVVESSGKMRARVSWNEAADVSAYSIKTFEFHPSLNTEVNEASRIYLGIDEVVGRETIWHTVDAEKLLRAYARGQHDLIPKVQTVANKFDPPRDGIRVIPKDEK